MKVALCQSEIVFENKEANYIKAGKMIAGAATSGVELVLFPEMSFTGFSMNTAVTAEEPENSPTITLIKGYAEQYKVAVGFGLALKTETELCENHYMVIDPEGNVIADYTKIHPFSFAGEDSFFRGGTEPVTFAYKGRTFGLSLCYDLRFPELYEKLSKTAEVLIVAANWPDARLDQFRALLPARAIENQSYVLAINCLGEQGSLHYSGYSTVINPQGIVLASRGNEEVVLLVDLEDIVLGERLSFPVKSDRKEELYQGWYKEE
ncbi:MAG: carbon-nitrogen family hydrolase [Lachnospiraceae bacterium]|nr:carbon-nitrogen family hydrolase [Lachnospiraceae bacterium]